MSSDEFVPNLEAYFARIGYDGPVEPTLLCLKSIQWLTLISIPFESIDVARTNKIRLDPVAVENKIVHQGRGGYCFEQNMLLYHVLKAIGFEIRLLISRVLGLTSPEIIPGNTHSILHVMIDNVAWLVDVGYGPWGSPEPLQIHTTDEQITSCDTRRIVHSGENYTEEVYVVDKWMSLFRFNLSEVCMMDWEIANWYSCTHPKAFFVKNTLVSLFTEECRYVLFNKEFTIRKVSDNSISTQRKVTSPEDYLALLHDYFKLSGVTAEMMDFCPPIGSTWID